MAETKRDFFLEQYGRALDILRHNQKAVTFIQEQPEIVYPPSWGSTGDWVGALVVRALAELKKDVSGKKNR